MTSTRVNDIDLYYEEHGPADAEPVLLIMGFMSHAGMWFPQVEALKERYRVIAFDNRGCGRSAQPEGPYTTAQLADDAAALLAHLHVASAHIVGASMGGMIAQEFALRHPGRVRTLALLCTSPGGPRSFGYDAMVEASAVLKDAKDFSEVQTPERLQEMLLTTFTPEFLQGGSPAFGMMIAAAMQHPPSMAGVRGQNAAVLSHDTLDRLPQIAAPTLVMAGEDDGLLDPRNSPLLAERIPGAELRMFPGLRHGFNIEDAADVNAALLDFLGRHAERAAA